MSSSSERQLLDQPNGKAAAHSRHIMHVEAVTRGATMSLMRLRQCETRSAPCAHDVDLCLVYQIAFAEPAHLVARSVRARAQECLASCATSCCTNSYACNTGRMLNRTHDVHGRSICRRSHSDPPYRSLPARQQTHDAYDPRSSTQPGYDPAASQCKQPAEFQRKRIFTADCQHRLIDVHSMAKMHTALEANACNLRHSHPPDAAIAERFHDALQSPRPDYGLQRRSFMTLSSSMYTDIPTGLSRTSFVCARAVVRASSRERGIGGCACDTAPESYLLWRPAAGAHSDLKELYFWKVVQIHADVLELLVRGSLRLRCCCTNTKSECMNQGRDSAPH